MKDGGMMEEIIGMTWWDVHGWKIMKEMIMKTMVTGRKERGRDVFDFVSASPVAGRILLSSRMLDGPQIGNEGYTNIGNYEDDQACHPPTP